MLYISGVVTVPKIEANTSDHEALKRWLAVLQETFNLFVRDMVFWRMEEETRTKISSVGFTPTETSIYFTLRNELYQAVHE